MRYEDTPALTNPALALPTERGIAHPFGAHGAIYWLRCDTTTSWTVLGASGELVVSFVERGDVYVEKDERAGDGMTRSTWRNLVANFV